MFFTLFNRQDQTTDLQKFMAEYSEPIFTEINHALKVESIINKALEDIEAKTDLVSNDIDNDADIIL